jgi:ketosteroid isomerase-like protein
VSSVLEQRDAVGPPASRRDELPVPDRRIIVPAYSARLLLCGGAHDGPFVAGPRAALSARAGGLCAVSEQGGKTRTAGRVVGNCIRRPANLPSDLSATRVLRSILAELEFRRSTQPSARPCDGQWRPPAAARVVRKENRMSSLEQRVVASLDRSVTAFNAGTPEFFDEFAEDAMIFTVDSAEPIKGREQYRQKYQASLSSTKREKTILDRNLQIIGNKAVVTQTAKIAEGESTADVRQTIVYGETGEGLKVMHLHTALLTPTSANEAGRAAIRVVNEQIAPVSGALGVAQ